METSIVPEIMNSKKIKFYDSNGIVFQICEPSDFLFNFNRFVRPSLTIDKFEKQKYKYIETKKISIEQLKEFGFKIVSVKTNSEMRNIKRQIRSYLVESINTSIPNSEICLTLPRNHLIEYDYINHRVRLVGPNGWPYRRAENATPWKKVKDE